MKNAMLILVLMAAPLLADNLTLAKSAEHLTGAAPSPDTYGFSIDAANLFDGLEDYGALPSATFSEIVANTNSAAFIAWCASQPDVLLAAELQQLSASLDALVFAEFGEHIDGTDEQLARLSAVVVSSLESNRIEYAKAETLTELQTAGTHINNLRSIISLQTKIVSLKN